MPLHEYYCPKCNEKFEYLHKTIKEGRLDRCPMCGEKVDKLVPTGTSVKFVGHGFPGNDLKHPPPPPSSTNRGKQREKEKELRKAGWQESFTPKH